MSAIKDYLKIALSGLTILLFIPFLYLAGDKNKPPRHVNMQRWHTLAAYYNRHCGSRVQKIPLDAGACCPNRDGTLSSDGCIFCNANGSGSGRAKRGDSLLEQWNTLRSVYLRDDPNTRFIAYLQSFSNTYGPQKRLQQLLQIGRA